MARSLTKKQKGFVKDYIKTGNGTEAALNNYDVANEHVAAVIASENLTKPEIVNSIQEALPDELLATVHLEGLMATKRSGTGGMLLNPKKGEFGHTDVDETPDYAVRHKYLDSAYKLKGSYAAEKHVNLNLDVNSSERTRELGNRLVGLFGRRS